MQHKFKIIIKNTYVCYMKLFLNAIGRKKYTFFTLYNKIRNTQQFFLNVFLTKSLIKISKKGAPIFKTSFYMAIVLSRNIIYNFLGKYSRNKNPNNVNKRETPPHLKELLPILRGTCPHCSEIRAFSPKKNFWRTKYNLGKSQQSLKINVLELF